MNWGFIGFGNIAHKFLKSLLAVPGQNVSAIATKSGKDTASYKCPEAVIYNDYADLVKDENVDIVYICTTHNFHVDQVLMCLDHHKHVICEKPMALDLASAQKIKSHPRSTFLMEAMWTRYLPAYKKAMQLIKEGLIGEVHWMTANFTFDHPGSAEGRHRNPALAGGAMYDIGIYPLALALDLAGNKAPVEYRSMANWSEENVDINMTFDMRFENGFVAQCFCALDKEGSNDAIIMGKKGSLVLKDFWRCQKIEHITNEEVYTYYLPYTETGYFHEIEEAVQCIENGLMESPSMTIDHSVLVSKMMETLLKDAKNG